MVVLRVAFVKELSEPVGFELAKALFQLLANHFNVQSMSLNLLRLLVVSAAEHVQVSRLQLVRGLGLNEELFFAALDQLDFVVINHLFSEHDLGDEVSPRVPQ